MVREIGCKNSFFTFVSTSDRQLTALHRIYSDIVMVVAMESCVGVGGGERLVVFQAPLAKHKLRCPSFADSPMNGNTICLIEINGSCASRNLLPYREE